MKALFYKDIMTLKRELSIFVVLIFMGTLIASVKMGVNSIIIFTYIAPLILLIKSFGLDKNSKFEKFIVCSGISKRSIVFSKYLLFFSVQIITLIFTILSVYLSGNLEFLRSIAVLFVVMFISFVIIPVYYKFGYSSVFISMIISYLGIAIFFVFFPEEWKQFEIVKTWFNNDFLIYSSFILVDLVAFFISFGISIKVVKNKDF